jgi:hypothetical protein
MPGAEGTKRKKADRKGKEKRKRKKHHRNDMS